MGQVSPDTVALPMSGNDLHAYVRGDDIIVTLPGANFKVVFQRFPVAPQLMANWSARDAGMTTEEFLTEAWQLCEA